MNIQELETWKYIPPNRGGNPVQYAGHWISAWNHPTTIANDLLRDVKHYGISGLQLVGAMGQGKSTFATVIAHHIHKIDPTFNIVWGEDEDYTHIKRFAEGLPKVPTIAIFDDTTYAEKTKGAKASYQNFSDLTKIRHIFNESGAGNVPIIIILIAHYSLSVAKITRNVLRNTGFLTFGNTERSNIDLLAPKDSQARIELLKFARIFHEMNQEGEIFTIRGPAERAESAKKQFKLDEPFRPCCVVSGTEAHVILFAKDDVCNLCAKRKTKQFIEAIDIFEKIKHAYGTYGIQALRLSLWKRGHVRAISPKTTSASVFIEDSIFSHFETNFEELTDLIYSEAKRHIPKRIYRKKALEEELQDQLYGVSKIKSDESDLPLE